MLETKNILKEKFEKEMENYKEKEILQQVLDLKIYKSGSWCEVTDLEGQNVFSGAVEEDLTPQEIYKILKSYVAFYINDIQVLKYSKFDEFTDEREETKKQLAYEHNVSPDEVKTKILQPNLYQNLKDKQEKEFNKLPLYFAFGNEQLQKIIKELGFNSEEEFEKNIVVIGAGGFILKKDYENYKKVVENQRQEKENYIKNDIKGTGYIKDMFIYELANHEFTYTGDIESTLISLNLSLNEINKNYNLLHGLKLAIEELRTEEL